ncbi:MAG: excisionase family DNA-binding protein [Sulfurovaceae bacterium]|jgi:predicted DNA-binding transcriptional regulator AlpA|nr:excisionase family DNA-binding protein [Sulfurovaceae bacterium]
MVVSNKGVVNSIQNNEDKFLSAKSAADWLGISRSTFYRLLQDGKLPSPRYPLSPYMPRWLKSDILCYLKGI